MNYVYDVLRGTNWPLLREQKALLIDLLMEKTTDGTEVHPLDGLLNFLDALQDAVVVEGIAKEEDVFTFE